MLKKLDQENRRKVVKLSNITLLQRKNKKYLEVRQLMLIGSILVIHNRFETKVFLTKVKKHSHNSECLRELKLNP